MTSRELGDLLERTGQARIQPSDVRGVKVVKPHGLRVGAVYESVGLPKWMVDENPALKALYGETFGLPCLLVSEANRRDHFRVKAERVAMQRGMARNATHSGCLQSREMAKQKIPLTIEIVRIGKCKLDSDNLQSSAKAIRDGIADALGIDDGDESACTWTYAQEVRAFDPGVRVTIKARE